jgi:hypothetical protein
MIRLMASVPPLETPEVSKGQHLGLPGAEGPAKPGDLGDRAAGEAVEDLGRDLAALGWVLLANSGSYPVISQSFELELAREWGSAGHFGFRFHGPSSGLVAIVVPR